MSNSSNCGIQKKHLTGNQRKKLRNIQASKLGMSPEALLKQRHDRMKEWQYEKDRLKSSKCSNCGTLSHSFKWCPFAHDFELQKPGYVRFRGPHGQWGSEPAVTFSSDEKRRFRNHFGLLSMPIDSNAKPAIITPLLR